MTDNTEPYTTALAILSIILVAAILAFVLPTGEGLVIGAAIFLMCTLYLMSTRSSHMQ